MMFEQDETKKVWLYFICEHIEDLLGIFTWQNSEHLWINHIHNYKRYTKLLSIQLMDISVHLNLYKDGKGCKIIT